MLPTDPGPSGCNKRGGGLVATEKAPWLGASASAAALVYLAVSVRRAELTQATVLTGDEEQGDDSHGCFVGTGRPRVGHTSRSRLSVVAGAR